MNARKNGLRALDIAIIIVVLALTFASAAAIYGNRGDSVHLEIEAPGGRWVYALDEDRTVSIKGTLGDTVVEIRDGHAHVLSSPCANQTCVAAPDIAHKGEWNACLPNEVMIRVAGDKKAEEGLDAIVY